MSGETQSQLYFEDVVVPEENVLVRGRDSFKQQLKGLNWERIGNAILNLAIARIAAEKALDYAQQREQFGQPSADFQGIEWKLADMVKELQAARELVYGAAQRAHERGDAPDRLQTSIAKLYSAEAVDHIVDQSLQIHEANGYQQGHPLVYLYRKARGRRLAGGTDEIQRNTIGRAVKKMGIPSVADD